MLMGNEKEQTHLCEQNWYKDVYIRYEKINKVEWSWILEQAWEVSEIDLEDDIAGHEGQAIYSQTLMITYCPFCGSQLEQRR